MNDTPPAVINLAAKRDKREFSAYLAQKQKLKDELVEVVNKHLVAGCTPSMVVDMMVDVAKMVREFGRHK